MSDSEQPTEKPAEVKDLTKAHARQMLIKQCVFVFLVSSICAAYLQLNPGYLPTGLGDNQTVFTWNRNEGLPEGDGYYHIKAAYLYRTGEMFEAGENFHWTRNSIWNGHFSDKEFLYHIYLVPFTLMAEDQYHWQAFVSGAKLSAVIAAGLFMLALFSTMRQLKVPKAWFWTLAAGAVMGVFLPTRLTEPRSWVFGVCFAMLGWAALTRNSRKWAFVIAALFVLSYTGSWLLLAMAFFRAGFRFVVGPDDGSRKAALKQDLILTGVVFGGLLLGWILHPGSFALLKIWWVQNIVVPYTHGFGTPTGIVRGITGWMLDWGPDAAIPRVPNEMLGGELKGVPITVLLMGNTFEVTMPVLLPCLSAWFRVRPSKTTVATFIIGVGFTVLHFYNGRFVEYAVPFLLLAGAKWMSEILAARNVRKRIEGLRWSPRRLFRISVGVMVVLLMLNLYRTGEGMGYRPKSYYKEAGEAMQAHPEIKGKVVYNIAWDTFPELMLYRSDCDYIWGMDPMFTAAKGDRDARRVVGFMQNDMTEWGSGPQDVVRILREDFHADYLFVYDRAAERKRYFEIKRWAELGLLEPVEQRVEYGFALYRIPPAP